MPPGIAALKRQIGPGNFLQSRIHFTETFPCHISFGSCGSFVGRWCFRPKERQARMFFRFSFLRRRNRPLCEDDISGFFVSHFGRYFMTRAVLGSPSLVLFHKFVVQGLPQSFSWCQNSSAFCLCPKCFALEMNVL